MLRQVQDLQWLQLAALEKQLVIEAVAQVLGLRIGHLAKPVAFVAPLLGFGSAYICGTQSQGHLQAGWSAVCAKHYCMLP